MIFSIINRGYDEVFTEEVIDINDNHKYIKSSNMYNEATIILREGFNIEKLSEASNNFWDSFKSKIKTIVDAIKGLWDKFMYKIEQMFTTDIDWLNQYGGALLKAKIPDGTYSMYAYPNSKAFMTKLFAPNIFPPYNSEDPKLFAALESPETFRSTYIPQFVTSDKDMNFSDGVKFMARGKMEEPQDYNSTAIARFLPEMVRYCKDYSKLADTLKKEKTALDNSINKILRDINKIKVAKPVAQEPTPGSPNPTEAPKADAPVQGNTEKAQPVKENFFIMAEGCNYSELALNERIELFNEAPGVTITPAVTNDRNKTIAKNDDGKIARVPNTVQKEDDKSEISKRYNTYIVEVFNLIGIRMSIAEEQFTTYMQVLKYVANASGMTVKSKNKFSIPTKKVVDERPSMKTGTDNSLKGDLKNMASKARDKVNSFTKYMGL
ncbi:MAG: hypothetical protein ACRC0G_07685 [Fusobacteriaceae bacterium]